MRGNCRACAVLLPFSTAGSSACASAVWVVYRRFCDSVCCHYPPAGSRLLGREGANCGVGIACFLLHCCISPQNVSGRLLVGLRWWNKINEDGSTAWVYESHPVRLQHACVLLQCALTFPSLAQDAEKTVPAMNKRIFWGSMYAAILAWGALAFMHSITFTLDWLVVDGTALALVGANLMGYVRCSQEADKRRSNPAPSVGGVLNPGNLAGAAAIASLPGVLPAITSSLAGSLFGTGPAPAAQSGATAPAASGMQGDVDGATVV